MAEIKFSQEALNDLLRTKSYISEELCNEQAACAAVAKIINNICVFEKFPESGAMLESIVDFSSDYRFLVCGKYPTFYRVENNTVFIVRILYGRRDFMRILFGSEEN